jgi:autotransporter-associated beta strand protein
LGGGVLSVDHLAGGSAALVAQVYNNTSGWGQQPYIAPYSTLQNTIATPSSAGLTIAGFALTSAGGNTGLLYIGNADGNNPDPGTWGRLGLGNLGAGNNNDNFDVVFSGYIKLSAGTYNFATNTDDGSMLYIGGQTVVSNNYYQGWGGQGNAQRTGSFTAPAAGYYSIQIPYYQGGGGFNFEVMYQTPGSGTWVDVPNTILSTNPLTTVSYGNPVSLTAPSTIDVPTYGIADFGVLTLSTAGNGLSSTGMGTARFASTTLGGAAATYTFAPGASAEIVPGVISGGSATTIAVSGPGAVTLGSTAGTIAAGTKFQVNNGTLLAIGPGTLLAAPVALNGGTLMLAAASSDSVTYDVIATDPLTLTGTGGTVLAGSGGLLVLPGATAAGAVNGGNVTLGGTGSISIASGQTLGLGSMNGYVFTVAPSLTFANSGTILATVGTAVLDSVYSGAANNLAANPGATLVLNASNPMTGTLSVSNGAFIAGTSGSFGSATLQFSGGTIGANATLTGGNAIPNPLSWGSNHSINIGGSALIQFTQPLSLASGAYTITDPNGYSTFSGVLSGNGGLNVTGFPTLSNTNAYSGGTTFNNNTSVTITNNHGLGSGSLYLNNGGFQSTVPLTGALAVTNAWTVPSGQTGYFNGINTIEMTAGTNTGSGINVSVNNGALRAQIDGPITGTGGLWKQGSNTGTLTMNSTASTYSGGTYMNNGTGNIDVPVSSVGPAGAPTSGPLGTGTLTINNNNNNGNINVGNITGTAPVTIGNPISMTGPCGFSGGAAGITFNGPFTLNSNWWDQSGNNGNGANIPKPNEFYVYQSVKLAGTISDGATWGQAGFILEVGNNWGGGGLTLSGANNFTDAITISQGTLIAASPTALGLSTNLVTMNDGNTNNNNDHSTALLISGNNTVPNPIYVTNNGNAGTYLGGATANSSTFTGPITLGQSATLVAAPGGIANFATAISGAGGVVVGDSGYTGTVVLSGSNTYTGGTTVAYGTLTGSGTITAGLVTVNSGAALSPAPGAPLTITNTLTMNDGSTFALTASGGSVSTANVTGLSTPSGSVNLLITAADGYTISGGSNTFLYYANGPAASQQQTNWNIASTTNATWAVAGAGPWDTHGNWSGYQVQNGQVWSNPAGTALQLVGATALAYSDNGPTPVANVFIQQSTGATVAGPALATTVAGLTLGSSSGGVNELDLTSGGPLTVTGPATVNPTGRLNAAAGSLTTPVLSVAGTANFGPASSVALPSVTVTGAGQFTALGGGNIGSLSLSGGTPAATVGSGVAVSTASVAAGTAVFNNTAPMTSLTLTGGVTTLGSGAIVGTLAAKAGSLLVASGVATAGTADFTSSAATINTQGGSVAITGNVALPGGTFSYAGNSSLGVSGADLSNAAAPCTLTLSGGTVAGVAAVTITGFGSGWTLNGGAAVNNKVLTLIDGNAGEARSAFYMTNKLPTTAFTASFVYQDVGGGGADGSTFCLQNSALNAVGGGGGGLGYAGISPSMAVAFNVYNGHTVGTQYYAGGIGHDNGGLEYNATGNVNLASGDPILVNLSYDGTTLHETLTDQNNQASFSTTYTVNIPQDTGANTAYVGFTGGSGGVGSLQTISNAQISYGGALTNMPNANVIVTAASSFAAISGTASTFGNLTLGANLTFTGGTAGTTASFANIMANTSATIGNDTNDSTGLAISGTVGVVASKILTIAAPIVGDGKTQLIVAGPGTLILTNAANSYTGGTSVNAGSTLQFGDGQNLNGNVLGNISNSSLVVFANPLALTYSGTISGTGRVLKFGAGTLSLSASQTYNGGTTINGGTLEVDSTLASPTVTVNTNGALAGVGTLGTVNVNGGGALSPGVALTGTLTGGTVNLSANAGINLGITGANLTNGLSVGSLTFSGGSVQLTVSGTPLMNTPYTFVSSSGGFTGTANWNVGGAQPTPPLSTTIVNWLGTTGTPPGNGFAWDDVNNWDLTNGVVPTVVRTTSSLTLSFTQGKSAPITASDVVIGGVASITGPAANAQINSLTLGDGVSSGTSLLQVGTGNMTVTLGPTNLTGGWTQINSNGTLLIGPSASNPGAFTSNSLSVAGSVGVASGGSLTVGSGGATIGADGTGAISVSGAGSIFNASSVDLLGGQLNLGAGSGGSISLLNVSGGTATLAGAQTVNTATAYSGTMNLAGGTVNTANVSGGAVVQTGGTITAANLTSGSGGSLAANGGVITTLTVSDPTATATVGGSALVGSAIVSGGAGLTASGGTIGSLSIDSAYAGTTTLGSGATGPATLTVPSGTVNLNNINPMTSLTVSGGTVNTGAGVTAASVAINGSGVAPPTVTTTGTNFLSVTNTLSVVTTASTIAVNGSSFAVAGSNLTANIDTLKLNGGITAINYQAGSMAPGLNIRAWNTNSRDGGQLDFYGQNGTTGTWNNGNIPAFTGAVSDGPNVSFNPANPTAGTSDSTYGGTLNKMNTSINVDGTLQNPGDVAWFQRTPGTNGQPATNGMGQITNGMGTGAISLGPAGYADGFTVEYRGKLLIPASGTYYFATSSDDGSAMWLAPSASQGLPDNPLYSNAIVQNNYSQGMTTRYSGALTVATSGYYDILIRYNQGGGQDGLQVQWSTDDQNWSLIPGDDFVNSSLVAAGANMSGTTVLVSSNSMFSPGSGYASTFGNLTLGANLTFTGGTSGTSAGFANILANTTTATIANDVGDLTGLAISSGGTVGTANSGQTLTIAVPIVDGAGQTALVVGGSGTVVLTASNTFSGGTTINSGTLQLGNGGLTGSIPDGDIADNGILAVNRAGSLSVSGLINGTGGVVQKGPGTLTLSPSYGTSNYSGGTTVTGGTLGFTQGGLGSGPVVVDPVAGGNTTATMVWGSGPTTDLTAQNGGLTLNSGTTVFSLGGTSNTVTFDGTILGSGGLEIANGTLQFGNFDTSGSLGNVSPVTIDASGVLAFNRTDTSTVTSNIGGQGGVVQQGGTLILTGSNTYQGGTTVNAGATVQVGNGPGTGGSLGSGPVSLAGYGTALVFNRSGTCIVPGAISDIGGGSGSVVQMGPGTVALTGSNSYTGGTSVTGGQLAAENLSAIPSGSLLAISANGSVVLGTPGATEPLGSFSGGAGPLTSQSSAGGGQMASPALGGGGINPVPEPGTMALLAAAGACSLAAAWRKRRRG